jgi:hypothetical protein
MTALDDIGAAILVAVAVIRHLKPKGPKRP